MKRSAILLLGFIVLASPAFAQTTGNGAISGPHWGFNIIGHPKGISGDDSNGHAIMVPLKNANGPGLPSITCEADGTILTNDLEPTWTDQVPMGARLYFEASNTFEIVDRDATDGEALIKVPVDSANAITFDIFMRVLGKPNKCMNIDAYAYDADQLTGLYFWAGSVELSRKGGGRSAFVKVNDLFSVWYCQVDPATDACVPGTSEELSVFDNVFESYFWNILNDGTRLVQVRLYPRAQ